MKYSVLIVFVMLAAGVFPAASVSRWFTATFYDLRFTLHRYCLCTTDLYPLRDYSLNETEYLIYQMKNFLDQGNYDNEQLANVSALMDNICRSDADQTYPISVHIDVNKFGNSHPQGKANRCQAIDDALESMFYMFRRAALNRSEPLDFSAIQFCPNATDRSACYSLTDLINTSWITSDTILDHVCSITDSVKRYVQTRMAAAASSTSVLSPSPDRADKRDEQQPRAGSLRTVLNIIDRILDPLLGLQKRLAWESNNRLEMIQNRLSSGLGTVRDRLSNMFTSSAASNITSTERPARPSNGSSIWLNGTTVTPLPALGLVNASETTITVQRASPTYQSTTLAPNAAPTSRSPASETSSPLVTNSLN